MADWKTIVTEGKKASNPYLPELATVSRVIKETLKIKTFQASFDDSKNREDFHFEPGQVGQFSIFGVGEATFGFCSSPFERKYLEFTVLRTGEVTAAFHELSQGDQIGIRGPLGNSFPYSQMKGKNVVIAGGGVGIAPLRSLILFMLNNRKDYGDVKVIYGARTPHELCYGRDLREWQRRGDIELVLTVDKEFPGWEGRVGFVPTILAEEAPSPKEAVAVTCGPPIMIKFVVENLKKLGFKPEKIVTTLERRMKCGIGICGRCNIGPKYVCAEGPVFTLKELEELPNDF